MRTRYLRLSYSLSRDGTKVVAEVWEGPFPGRERTVQDSRPAPDLVERNFQVSRPNRLWVADITYVPSWAGFVYLAVVVDAFSRRVVGWSLRNDLNTRLVTDALQMALQERESDGVIHHSDQGTQYTSIEFGLRCKIGNRSLAHASGSERSSIDLGPGVIERVHREVGQKDLGRAPP